MPVQDIIGKERLGKDNSGSMAVTSSREPYILALLHLPSPTACFPCTVFAYAIFSTPFIFIIAQTCTRRPNGDHRSVAVKAQKGALNP